MRREGDEGEADACWNEGIFVERRRRRLNFEMVSDHSHQYCELYYLVSGRCRIFLDHSLYRVEAGDMVLIPPLAIHRTRYGIVQESERITIFFGREYLDMMEAECGAGTGEELFRKGKVAVEAGRRPYVEDLMMKLCGEQERMDRYSGMLKKEYLLEVLAFLGRSGGMEERLEEVTGAAEAAVQEAAQYIYHHYMDPLTLTEVAERVHMTPAYFSRKFKRVTGFGYKEYLNDVRLKEAARMLLETECSVTEIALACGFSDGNYFGDLFKKEKGISPRTYRKNPQIL